MKQALEGGAGAIHVFVRAPYALAASVGRQLDTLARQRPLALFQWVQKTRGWTPFMLSPGHWHFPGMTRSNLAIQEVQTLSRGEGGLIALEGIQSIADEQLTRLAQAEGLRHVFRLRLEGEGVMTSPSRAQAAMEMLWGELQRVQSAYSLPELHLVSSAPSAFLIEMGRFLRPTVYGRIVVYEYDPARKAYDAVVDLSAFQAIDPTHVLEVFSGEEAILYRLDGVVLPVARNLEIPLTPVPEQDDELMEWGEREGGRLLPPRISVEIDPLQRLDIHINLREPGPSRRPWELMFLAGNGPALLRPGWAMARFHAAEETPRATKEGSDTPRVLILEAPGASPQQSEGWGMTKLVRLLEAAGVEHQIISGQASLEDVLTALQTFVPEVVHLMGQPPHGDVKGFPNLVFGNPANAIQRAQQRQRFSQLTRPRLLLLQNDSGFVLPAQTTVPGTLLADAATACVYWQRPTSATAVQLFMAGLYRELLSGARVMDAVQNARLAMLSREGGMLKELGAAVLTCLTAKGLGSIWRAQDTSSSPSVTSLEAEDGSPSPPGSPTADAQNSGGEKTRGRG